MGMDAAAHYYVFEITSDPACFGNPDKRTSDNFCASWNDPQVEARYIRLPSASRTDKSSSTTITDRSALSAGPLEIDVAQARRHFPNTPAAPREGRRARGLDATLMPIVRRFRDARAFTREDRDPSRYTLRVDGQRELKDGPPGLVHRHP
ncbi:hypothetical protein SAMN05444161_7075 [Rhizobiales bacterium GAS191]|nr:hypothetical protein SAMN05444161_7075 [Rhizobiales bacterium GAS191]